MATTLADLESGEDVLPGPAGVDESVDPSQPPKPRRGRPPGSGGGASKAKLAQLEESVKEKLLEDMVLPGAFISPLVAANIEARAERTAKAVARIAAKNPAVRKSVERAIDGSDYLTILMFFLSSAICGMVDFGMMNPNAIPSRAAGVPELWETVYPDEEPGHNGVVVQPRGLLNDLEEE